MLPYVLLSSLPACGAGLRPATPAFQPALSRLETRIAATNGKVVP